MTSEYTPEQVFPFTPSIRERGTIAPGAAGTTQHRRSRFDFRRLPRWDRRKTLTITVVYKGGAEGWWLIRARAHHGVFAGCMALDDVMARVMSER